LQVLRKSRQLSLGTSHLDVEDVDRFWKKTSDSQGVSFCQGEGCTSVIARIVEDLRASRVV
jgi:hypothetical protein